MDRARTTALGEITVTAVLWGTSFPVINYGEAIGLNPELFAFLRFAIAAPVMAVAARWLGGGVAGPLRMKEVWVLGAMNGLGFLLQFLGQASTAASTASLLVNMSFLLTALLSAAYLGERFGERKVAGLALALVGAFLVTTGGDLGLVSKGELLGDALCLGSALVWGFFQVYNKRNTDQKHWDPVSVSSATIVVTAVFLCPAALALGKFAPLGDAAWEVIGYTVVLNTAVPFVLYQQSLRYLTATTSAIVQMLEIVTALAVSVAFLREALTPAVSAGAVLILASVVLVSATGGGGKSLSMAQSGGKGEGV